MRKFIVGLFASFVFAVSALAQDGGTPVDLTQAIPDTIVLGNPDGDIEIHEFSDYFCPYCQRMTAEMAPYLERDGNIRFVLHYYPNHGQKSFDFSNLGVAAYNADPTKFYELHQWIMAQRSRVTIDQAYDKAVSMGYDRAELEAGAANPDNEQMFRVNISVADRLGIRGTPSLTVENAVSRGYPGVEPIEEYIAQVRAER